MKFDRHKVYDSDLITMFLDESDDGRLFLHSDIKRPHEFKALRQVLETLEVELADRGVTKLYTMADSENGFKFNQLMGFETTLETVPEYGLEFMSKDIV